METESAIIGIMFMILGGFSAVRPDLVLRFQIWVQRTVMGAEYIPGKRTYKIMRFIGAIMIVIGLLAITGVFELK